MAASGVRMPIAADLLLHEQPDPEAVMLDSRRLGQVMAETARRYRTPLAYPLMDLRLEKADLLARLGIPEAEVETYHFTEPPTDEDLIRASCTRGAEFGARNRAHIASVAYIARETDLTPVGMAIGPFSLMTKLLADPITPLALAGMGVTAAEDSGVLNVERCLALAEMAVERACEAQIEAGARAMLICEPAANAVYISPKQVQAGADTFERFVLEPNARVRDRLEAAGVDLIFHNCGQLSDAMVEEFATRLHPAMLSLGSTRRLWEDAARVPDDVVLFGNLPTKSFYSDAAMPLETVLAMAEELTERMRATGHAFVLGSECDVLYVADSAATIRAKVDAVWRV